MDIVIKLKCLLFSVGRFLVFGPSPLLNELLEESRREMFSSRRKIRRFDDELKVLKKWRIGEIQFVEWSDGKIEELIRLD